jgi:hypothetical protein
MSTKKKERKNQGGEANLHGRQRIVEIHDDVDKEVDDNHSPLKAGLEKKRRKRN